MLHVLYVFNSQLVHSIIINIYNYINISLKMLEKHLKCNKITTMTTITRLKQSDKAKHTS